MEKKDPNGRRLPFSLNFVKASTGVVVSVNQAVLTYSYEGNRTYNLKMLPSGQVRKIRQLSVVEFEGDAIHVRKS